LLRITHEKSQGNPSKISKKTYQKFKENPSKIPRKIIKNLRGTHLKFQ